MPAVSLTRQKSIAAQQARSARDLRLIEAYRDGRREAFDELVGNYNQSVRSIVTEFRVPLADVDDLVQEVFLRVFRNLNRFRDEASFYTWLYRITVNVFFDHNKKRKRAEVRLERLQIALIDATDSRRRSGDWYDACQDTLTRDAFAEAIDALPETFRAAVTLRSSEIGRTKTLRGRRGSRSARSDRGSPERERG